MSSRTSVTIRSIASFSYLTPGVESGADATIFSPLVEGRNYYLRVIAVYNSHRQYFKSRVSRLYVSLKQLVLRIRLNTIGF